MIGITLVLFLLLGLAFAEIVWPQKMREGFESLIPASSEGYFAKFIPRRGDVGPDEEEGGYIQDPRYYRGYADIQRLGVNHDFCRMVESKVDGNKFFACALAGTENLSSTSFKTPTVREGFALSRDDYMHDMNYCRILKGKTGAYEALCNNGLDTEFDSLLSVDTNPPADIKTLLSFYQGCVFWYRFRDDMIDYVDSTKIMIVGGSSVDEKPNPPTTTGIHFNGIDQYLRIGDNSDLELGTVVPLRSLRATMVWVYFDEFTNNARIFDFGNGPGHDTVSLSIIGKGDTSTGITRPPLLCGSDSTVPTEPSGAQPVPLLSPRELMEQSSANVDGFASEDSPRRLPSSRIHDKVKLGPKDKATLLYEVWDQRQRKMRIKVPSIIEKKKWTHIVVTALSTDAFRPDIAIYVNGEKVLVEESGFLPQASTLTNCYIGKSNADTSSRYENRDELFKGNIFDLRGYKVPLSEKVIKDSYAWGKKMLPMTA